MVTRQAGLGGDVTEQNQRVDVVPGGRLLPDFSHPDLPVQIEGHTDSVGSDGYNQRLSERRAESVRAYLVEQRVAPAVVGTAGFGESRPVATNGTAAGRQQNRRVELVVTGESIGR